MFADARSVIGSAKTSPGPGFSDAIMALGITKNLFRKMNVFETYSQRKEKQTSNLNTSLVIPDLIYSLLFVIIPFSFRIVW